MGFKRLDVIVKDVIENARKAELLTTRSTISGMSPTELGGGQPHVEDSSRPPCAREEGQPAQSESEKAPDPKARPVKGGNKYPLVNEHLTSIVRHGRAAIPSPFGSGSPPAAARLCLITVDGVRVHFSPSPCS